ncbi:MAG: class I SAM-dependent DNA methyltransferase [Selenomonadaceae bacterium]|nr:class I SAM-dependent DNA methyltransferase [Selenomonadaceae bacterium]
MTDIDIAFEAKKFSMDWHEHGYEKGETQKFWRALLKKILRVDEPDNIISFEQPVKIDGQTKFIDAYLAATKVLIEQKSFGVDLNKPEKQSDGSELTPYQQALRYAQALNEPPRWIITCNFAEFHIYKSERKTPTLLNLRDLIYEYPRLNILIDPNADDSSPQERISSAALADIDKIYNAFAQNYQKNKITDYKDALNKICTRLVFCLYAGDAKIFDTANKVFDSDKFFGYIFKFDDKERINALQNIFDVFSLDKTLRDNLDDDLKNFPYINGGLFDEKIPLPAYNRFITNPAKVIENVKAIRNFRWREISPPVFGAMFESKFKNRNEGGMFYTSVENIHKVIDPLFMDELRDEFNAIKAKRKDKIAFLKNFQDKLASLNFLDPACGSGNFLTEIFLSLRRLENEVIEELVHLYADIPFNPIKVTPRQFYGIEIDSFAVAVARLALCIADIQMKRETSWIINRDLPELPLDKYISIRKANALRVDWSEVVLPANVDYIVGNPPYKGRRYRSHEQQAEVSMFFDYKDVDYVACWYKKAAKFIHGTNIRCTFLSTNSIMQGEQVTPIWKEFFSKGIHIDFANRTFNWTSDSENMAHVHCVIVGFSSAPNNKPKVIFDGNKIITAQNINAYLLDAPNVFIEIRSNPIQKDVPKMRNGNVPLDGDALKIEAEDYENFIRAEPAAKKYIKRLIGGYELIYNNLRYVLWLKGVPMSEINKMPLVAERVELCKKNRLAMCESTRKLAKTPTTFRDTFNPAHYIALPMVSSENRRYIPMAYFNEDIIPTNQVQIIPDATIYHFGILTSSIHMAWVRIVAGRFKSDYRYSKDVVYNNFIWCSPSSRQKRRIEETAAEILRVRADFSNRTLAELYDEKKMPADLRDAHKENDYAVALAYGFEKFLEDEPRIVAELMKLYKEVREKVSGVKGFSLNPKS